MTQTVALRSDATGPAAGRPARQFARPACRKRFQQNVRGTRQGAAAGPSVRVLVVDGASAGTLVPRGGTPRDCRGTTARARGRALGPDGGLLPCSGASWRGRTRFGPGAGAESLARAVRAACEVPTRATLSRGIPATPCAGGGPVANGYLLTRSLARARLRPSACTSSRRCKRLLQIPASQPEIQQARSFFFFSRAVWEVSRPVKTLGLRQKKTLPQRRLPQRHEAVARQDMPGRRAQVSKPSNRTPTSMASTTRRHCCERVSSGRCAPSGAKGGPSTWQPHRGFRYCS